MRTFYDVFALRRDASRIEVEASFRRFIARYRPTLNIEQLLGDTRFRAFLNAYLTLNGPGRAAYDARLKPDGELDGPAPTPLEEMPTVERRLLMARIAYLRRETVEAIHLLRSLLEREPKLGGGWALLGEVYFAVDRLGDGIRAYERAVQADPTNTGYGNRLLHAMDVRDGKAVLELEPSPEEELLREERRRRRRTTTTISLIGIAILLASFFYYATYPETQAETFLFVPWWIVFIQCGGIFVLFSALSYGRLLQPFEQIMIQRSMYAGARGEQRNVPYGLLLFVLSAVNMWLALLGLLVMAFLDDEWPTSPTVMLSACLVVQLAMTGAVFLKYHEHWTGMIIWGGNLLGLAALFGWWVGSLWVSTASDL